jgi:hypothetical protein
VENDQRLAFTVYTIHRSNITTLCQCFLKPRLRVNDADCQAIRNSIRNDRGDLRRYLIEIVRSLQRMCQHANDDANFRRFALQRNDAVVDLGNLAAQMEQDADDVPEESEIEMNED